jgi:sodium transport system permease protein
VTVLRPTVLRALLGKEAREVLRDRRTLLLTLVVPALVYPLVIAGMGQMTAAAVSSLKGRVVAVALAPGLPEDVSRAVRAAPGVEAQVALDPAEEVRAGRARAGLAPEGGAGDPDHLALVLDGANDESRAAAERLEQALARVRQDRLAARLGTLGVDLAFLEPLRVTSRNVSSQERMQSYGAARLLPFLLIILSLMGAAAAAVDTTAGERERGTLLTLLSTPVHPVEVATAKLVVVAAVAMAAGVVNLLALGATLASTVVGAPGLSLSFGPRLVAGCLVALVPTALYGAALLLALAALGRTTREAQTATAPALFTCLALSAVVAFPGVKATVMLNALPVAGPALLMRDLLMGEATWSQGAVVVVSSVLTLWLVVAFAARVLTSEPMASAQVSVAAVVRDLAGRRQPTALTAAALACLLLGVTVYVAPLLQGGDLAWGLAGTQVAIVTVALGFLAVLRLEVRDVVGLRHLPPGRGLAAALLLGLSLAAPLAVAEGWLVRVSGMEDVLKQAAETLGPLLTSQLTPVVAVLVLGLMPGVLEEVAFRGALQGALHRVMAPGGAILVQALVFGLAHGHPLRFPPTFVLGILLGVLRHRTGSVLPGMVLHATHNSLAVLALGGLSDMGADEEALAPLLANGWLWAADGLALAGGAWLLARVRRPDPPPG